MCPCPRFCRPTPTRGACGCRWPPAAERFRWPGQGWRYTGGQTHTFYRGLTDESGIVQGIALPALPAAWSQAPDTASISGTDYLVSVRHPMFVPQEDREATVYARIESILPVMLEPVI